MTKISVSMAALAIWFSLQAHADESQLSQAPEEKAQHEATCKAQCQAKFPDCSPGPAPMHSACGLFNECLNGCE